MRVKLGNGLIFLNVLNIILILVITFSKSFVPRIILGVPFLLFIPGYTLLAALFTKKEGMNVFARVALSCILSITITALTGFILNFTPGGIKLQPIIYSIFAFTLIFSAIAWLRQRRLPDQERFSLDFDLRWPGLGKGIWDRVLTISLILVIIGAIGIVSYTFLAPRPKEKFTEFYILGQSGKAENYSIDLKIGVRSSMIVGIVNHEGREVNYRLETRLGDNKLADFGPVTLGDARKWEGEVVFVPDVAGDSQKLEFLLYKDNDTEPYLEPTYLWVDVSR